LQVATMAIMSLLLAGLVVLPLGPVAAVAQATIAFAALAVGNVASTTLLANETRAGYATTMTFNQSLNGAGWAIGSSLGGLLIALGGYGALGIGILVTGTASAVLAWRSAPREEVARVAALPPASAG
jgi:predicted MFS family arabinose efflux permease